MTDQSNECAYALARYGPANRRRADDEPMSRPLRLSSPAGRQPSSSAGLLAYGGFRARSRSMGWGLVMTIALMIPALLLLVLLGTVLPFEWAMNQLGDEESQE
jgi:hypothetical protein